MHVGGLDRLVAQARALPGDKASSGRPRAADRDARATTGAQDATAEEASAGPDARALRRGVGELLARLAESLEPALPRTLELAASAWDQADTLAVLDRELLAEARVLRAQARRLAADADPARRAQGVAAELTIDAAVGLVSLLERRLATLVRLKLRASEPDLITNGRPFLDVGAALAEAARAWV